MKKLFLSILPLFFLLSCAAQPSVTITKAQWEKMFPERWGYGKAWHEMYTNLDVYYPSMKIDLFSHENFMAALEELKNIKLKEVGANGKVTVYRMDTRKDKDWVELYSRSGKDDFEKVVDFSEFLNAPGSSKEDRLRELAAFLGNISHETGEGQGDEAKGLFYREELFFERFPEWGIPGHRYQDSDPVFASFPGNPKPTLYPEGSKKAGQVKFKETSYNGRGPIQLSWNYNYGAFSAAAFGDKMILLDDPDMLLRDGKIAFMSAIWFWMMPQYPKPSAHELMYPKIYKVKSHIEAWGFGHTIMIINGNIEGGAKIGGEEVKDKTVTRRNVFYKRYADIFGITIGENGEQLDTQNMAPYSIE